MRAIKEADKRDKMLTEYYDSVRQSTAHVKEKLVELESLGGSESDSALMGLQPPSYESLGIRVGAGHADLSDESDAEHNSGEDGDNDEQSKKRKPCPMPP